MYSQLFTNLQNFLATIKVKLSTISVCHAITKHIEIEHHFIYKKVLDRTIEVLEVQSKDNIAYILTQSLSKETLEDLRTKIRVASKSSL